MVEILGNNLEGFFEEESVADVKRTYKSDLYEVWEVYDSLFGYMNEMSEEEWEHEAGADAWYRVAEGSTLEYELEIIQIHGKDIKVWKKLDGNLGNFSTLTEYLCDYIGASTEMNVCACATDLAKYNNMSLGELFNTYN